LASLGPIGSQFTRVLEPTCGTGQFVAALLEADHPPREILAIEIQGVHCARARRVAAASERRTTRVQIIQANLFDLDLKRDLAWCERGPLMVIGNPPWVTNAGLGVLSQSAPLSKHNFRRLPGIEARTGASNFDLTEAIWLKLLIELADQIPSLALLCKTAVARSVLQFAHRARLGVVAASIHRIDAARFFGASVDACLLRVRMGPSDSCAQIRVFNTLTAEQPSALWGFACGRIVGDLGAYARVSVVDGVCPRTWRQGLKHDAADVMELYRDPRSGVLRNQGGELVAVEDEFIYPLAKSADLKGAPAESPLKAVIVTQRGIGQDTAHLAWSAPRLWRYLQSHAARFGRRKSSIYRGQPPFSLFGIGPYSFAPYKVAVSGLHKAPRFRVLAAGGERPVMLDDTCYFLSCETAVEAAAVAALCNDPLSLDFLASASFPDAKRPITKKLLQRLDLGTILRRTKHGDLVSRAGSILENDLGVSDIGPLPMAIEQLKREFSLDMTARQRTPARKDFPRLRSSGVGAGPPL
jgi:hypothetical protein